MIPFQPPSFPPFEVLYAQLRERAGQLARREHGGGITVRLTELVHDAFLRTVQARPELAEKHGEFLAYTVTVMRSLLADRARARRRQRARLGAQEPIDEVLDHLEDDLRRRNVELLDLVTVIEELEEEDRVAARMIEMRFLLGMTVEETAERLGIAKKELQRKWQFRKAWLERRLR